MRTSGDESAAPIVPDPTGGAVDATDANAGDGTDSGIEDIVQQIQPSFNERDDDGNFVGNVRRRRRRQAPKFSVIALVDDEAPTADATVPVAAGGASSSTAPTRTRTWLVRGPVRGWSDDTWRLSTLTTVRAAATLPAHEVYVRAMRWLVPGTYVDTEDAYESVRAVFRARTPTAKAWDNSSPMSSFGIVSCEDELTDEAVTEVLRQAANSARDAQTRVLDGHVALVHRRPAFNDPVCQAGLCALLRQRSVRAVAAFLRRGSDTMRSRWQLLSRGFGATAVARMRSILEFEPKDSSRGTGKRATRIRLSWGSSQVRLLPTKDELRLERRRLFDSVDRIGHFFFTRQVDGLVRWDYVRGSGSAGIRRYRRADGEEKRLRAYTNKYWGVPVAGTQGEDDSSSDEDNGIYFDNDNVETEGCYTPQEKDPERLHELVANSHSYLEDDDGQGELRIQAVAFDAAAALQRAIDLSAVSSLTAAAVAGSTPAVLTFAADGGTVRGKLLTAFTAGVSWPHLRNGRTDLTPLAYSLTGEKNVDKLVAKAVRDMLEKLVDGPLTVAVQTPSSTTGDPAGTGSCADPPLDAPDSDLPARAPLVMCDEVQVCGKLDARPRCTLCINMGTRDVHRLAGRLPTVTGMRIV